MEPAEPKRRRPFWPAVGNWILKKFWRFMVVFSVSVLLFCYCVIRLGVELSDKLPRPVGVVSAKIDSFLFSIETDKVLRERRP